MSITIVTDSRQRELEENWELNIDYIEQLESLCDEWQYHMPTALAQFLKKEIRLKRDENEDIWDELELFIDLLESERVRATGMTETRLIYCYECDYDYERDVEIGNEGQFLRNERCQHCESNDLELEDMDTGHIFNPRTHDFEER